MKDATEQDFRDSKMEFMHDIVSAIDRLTCVNGYIDEAVGSWHRYVDAQEKIADALDRIASAMEE